MASPPPQDSSLGSIAAVRSDSDAKSLNRAVSATEVGGTKQWSARRRDRQPLDERFARTDPLHLVVTLGHAQVQPVEDGQARTANVEAASDAVELDGVQVV